MNIQIDAVYQATYLNMISELIKQLKLPSKITNFVNANDQCQVSPGDAVHLLLLDILSGRQALVHVEEWAKEIDLHKLLHEKVAPSFFNDDALGRHLDRLHDAGIHQLLSSILLDVYKHEEIPLSVFHGDTTSLSLYGAYDRPSRTLNITEGYSRDKPGYKQIQFGVVANEDGIPIYADVHDGNESDKSWNPQVLDQLHDQFSQVDLDGFIYVADSAAMSAKTLKQAKAAGAAILTRGPNHLKIVKAALEKADETDTPWSEEISFVSSKKGATYRLFECADTYEGHDVRLIVAESSALDKKKEKTLTKKREQEHAMIEKQQQSWIKSPFHCEEDAIKAFSEWEKEAGLCFHTVQPNIRATEVTKRKRGRPKKGVEPEVQTHYILEVEKTFDETAFAHARRKASRFVLVTTVPTEWQGEPACPKRLLELYKGQINVEMNFRFLKNPFYIDDVYVHKPERVQVLGYLFLLALVIYRVFQRRIRQHITTAHPMKGAGGRTLTKPTGEAIFQLFKYIQVVAFTLPDNTKQRSFSRPLTYEQQRVLTALGMDESIYL
ncbi:IS1634 family transposase [Bacillus sp. FSL W7-1360]